MKKLNALLGIFLVLGSSMSMATLATPADVTQLVLAKKAELVKLTIAAMGTNKMFHLDEKSLNCIGAEISELNDTVITGVCTYQASAWQTLGTMSVALKANGISVTPLMIEVE